MRRRLALPLVPLALVTAGALPAAAQSGRDAVTERFLAAAPAIGEPMPDLVVYDESGEEVRLRKLLEQHYTVLVLGCLT